MHLQTSLDECFVQCSEIVFSYLQLFLLGLFIARMFISYSKPLWESKFLLIRGKLKCVLVEQMFTSCLLKDFQKEFGSVTLLFKTSLTLVWIARYHRISWFGRNHKDHPIPTILMWAGVPATSSGCSGQHPAWPYLPI